MPGHDTGPLLDIAALLADPLAATRDAGVAVVVFALFSIAFCLIGRLRWLVLCALMIVLFLSVALTRQLTDMLGLTIPQIIDMYNGVLPPDIDATALLSKLPVLQATTYADGLLVLGVGLLMIELAPWFSRVGPGRWQKPPSTAARTGRREPKAVAAIATATVAQAAPADLLLDELYIFADGLEQPLTFALLDPAGRVTRHRVRMEAAGYLGDAYYLRCRDLDAGNLRDVPAHMMSDIVDSQTGVPIDTDDMLADLSRVAYEAVSGAFDTAQDETGHGEEAPAGSGEAPAEETRGEPLFSVHIAPPEPAPDEPAPRGAG